MLYFGDYMDSYLSQAVNVVIAIVLTFFINLTIEYWVIENGTVTIGKRLESENFNYKPIEITNFSDKTMDNIRLSIPNTIQLASIIVSSPIQIELVNNSLSPKHRQLVVISGIKANSNVRLLIPLIEGSMLCCEVLNLKENQLTLKNDQNISSSFSIAFESAIRTTIIYGIIFTILALWIGRNFKELRQIIKVTEKDLQENSKFQDSLGQRIADVKLADKKKRVLLLKRITEYGKEIKFWRNTVKEILIDNVNPEELDKTLKLISEKLETRSTHSNINKEYEEFEYMTKLVKSVNEDSTLAPKI
jgi:hypothetical protein